MGDKCHRVKRCTVWGELWPGVHRGVEGVGGAEVGPLRPGPLGLRLWNLPPPRHGDASDA